MNAFLLVATRTLAAGIALAMLTALAATQFVQRPTITRAVDLIEVPAERIQVGSSASFTLRTSSSAKRVAAQGVTVRIFSLSADQKIPSPVAQVDGCDAYLSVSHQLVQTPSGQLKFATISVLDKDWLYLSNSLTTVEAGHYYFVFEQSSAAMSASEQFRIKSSDARKYFETGFRVTIDPTGQTISADSLRQKFLDRSAKLGLLKIEMDSKNDSPPCFGFQPVTVQARRNDVEQGVLVACELGGDERAAFPSG